MKIWEAAGSIVSMVLPALAGWAIVKSLWPEGPKPLRATIGFGIGLGIAGTAWMFAAMLGGSAIVNLAVSEGLLLISAVTLWRWSAGKQHVGTPPNVFSLKPHKAEVAAFVLGLMLGATVLGLTAYISHHGEFDATAIWNVKARLFYLRGTPLETLPDVTAPDYPLLLPSVVTRGWQYSQRDTIVIPMSLAIFFAAANLVILVSGLRVGATNSVALLAGCLLAGTPFYLRYSLSQTADIVMCFYITAAVTLFTISDFKNSGSPGLPVLSGLLTGFAACTKNEGSQFMAAMVLSQICLLLWDRRWRAGAVRIGLFMAGLIPPALALAVFRARAIPSVLLTNMTAETIQNRIRDTARHSAILAGYWRDLVHWGEWWINPLAILVLYAAVRLLMKPPSPSPWTWRFPALALIAMSCGYYLVYLFSPYEVNWHVEGSLPRLLFQLWPTALLCWGLLVSTSSLPAASWSVERISSKGCRGPLRSPGSAASVSLLRWGSRRTDVETSSARVRFVKGASG